MAEDNQKGFFDIHYGVSSIALTSGITIIATTDVAYHGCSLVASAASATVTIYDSISTASGNILDIIFINATTGTSHDVYIPVKAKKGIVANAVGAGMRGTVFFSPKG